MKCSTSVLEVLQKCSGNVIEVFVKCSEHRQSDKDCIEVIFGVSDVLLMYCSLQCTSMPNSQSVHNLKKFGGFWRVQTNTLYIK